MGANWIVWPIFAIELLVFLLLFLKTSLHFFKFSVRTWVHIILLVVCIGIVVSLSHDAITPLNLSF